MCFYPCNLINSNSGLYSSVERRPRDGPTVAVGGRQLVERGRFKGVSHRQDDVDVTFASMTKSINLPSAEYAKTGTDANDPLMQYSLPGYY